MLTYARLPLASARCCHLSNFCVPCMCVCSKYFLSLPHTARKYWEHPVSKHEFPVREDGTFQPCDRGQVFRDGTSVFSQKNLLLLPTLLLSEESAASPSIPVLPLDFLPSNLFGFLSGSCVACDNVDGLCEDDVLDELPGAK